METKNRLKEFEIQKKLGFGSYGVIFRVSRRSDKQTFVLKQIDLKNLKEKMRKNAINEAILLSKLKSPFIVEYLESFIEDNKLNIIMEYCEGGDLSFYLKQQCGRPLKEERIWEFMMQVILGLDYIHHKRILHRDIKTLNIFLTREEKVKIGDLGVAKLLNDSVDFAQTMVGTPFYLSPELCEEKPYNEKSDIWALGCLIYEMCTYRHPFEAANQGSLILKIIRGKYNPIANYSKELRDIVDSCLERDYKRRPTAALLLSRVYCQQKIETLGLKVRMDQHMIEQEKKKEKSQVVVNTEREKEKEKVIDQTPKVEKGKERELARRREEQQRKKRENDKRREEEKRLRQQAQRKEEAKRLEEKRREEYREELRKQEAKREELKREEMKKEEGRKQQLKREEIRKQQLRKEQLRKDQEELKKDQKRKQLIRKDELRKQYDRREEAKKQQLKKEQLRKQELRKQEARKAELKKQEEIKRKEEIRKQEQKLVQKLIEKTPVQKVKIQREIQPRVYEKKSVDVTKYSSRNKDNSEAKNDNKLFKPFVPTVPTNLINNLNHKSSSRKSVHSFEEKPSERYQKKEVKKEQVVQSANLPPRIRKGAPEGKARNALNPKHNITKQEEQMVLDLPDNPKERLDDSLDEKERMTGGESGRGFRLRKEIDDRDVLKKYEELSSQERGDQSEYYSGYQSVRNEGIDEGNEESDEKENREMEESREKSQGQVEEQEKEDKLDEEELEEDKLDRQEDEVDDPDPEPQLEEQQQFDFYSESKDPTNEQLQQVNLWQYDQQPQLPQFQPNDQNLMDQEQESQPHPQKQTKAHLQTKLQSNIRREDQLNKLMQLKIQQCKKAFKSSYQEVITFFRKKINMDSQYNQQDEREVEQFLKRKNLTNNNKFQNIYKIMHFEMELENCRNIIQGLCRKLNGV